MHEKVERIFFLKVLLQGSIQIRVQNGDWKSPIAKHLSDIEKKNITEKMNVEDGDLLVISVGPQLQSCTVLGINK